MSDSDEFLVKKLFKDKDYKFCKPLKVSQKSIFDFAEQAYKRCQELNIDTSNTLDLYKLVRETLGGKILVVGLNLWWDIVVEDSYKATIFIRDKEDFDIILPDYTTPITDTFKVAHEVGHYLLHSEDFKKGEKLKAFFSASDSDSSEQKRVEWEANCFALGFIMPTYLLKKLEKKDKEITGDYLSIYFGVPDEAGDWRANIYNDNQY